MTCEHASVRMSAGTTRRHDGSRLQRCLLCNMYRRRYGDGSFGAWHDRASGMPEPQRRAAAIGSMVHVVPLGRRGHAAWCTSTDGSTGACDCDGDSEDEIIKTEVASLRRHPSQLARVFSAEIVALARQLSAKRLEVDVLAMRLDRAVEDYNAAHGIGAPEPALALVGVYPP